MNKIKMQYINLISLTIIIFILIQLLEFDVRTIYKGVDFGAKPIFYAMNVALNINLMLFVFDSLEIQSSRCILLITRYSSRSKFYYYFVFWLMKKVLVYNVVKTILFVLLTFFNKTCLMPIGVWGKLILLNVSMDLLIVLLQSVLEFIFLSKWALLMISCHYILSIVVVDVLHLYVKSKWLPFVFFPNLGMQERLEYYNIPWSDAVGTFIIGWIFVFFVGKYVFIRKDLV